MPVWLKVILTAVVVITVPVAIMIFGLVGGFGRVWQRPARDDFQPEWWPETRHLSA
jgi:hypothetical protein